MLLFVPSWKPATNLICSVLLPGILALAYLGLIATNVSSLGGGFGSLDSITELFADRDILLAGWIHYLAFDLFIGAWQVREARRINVSHLLVAPCLIFTFLFGPTGLLLFFVLKMSVTRRISLDCDS